MGDVTELRRKPRRLDNPESQLGRVYLVLRDADYWLQLHEIGEAINARFNRMDSHAGISARLRELRRYGMTVASREKPGAAGTRPHQYRMYAGQGTGPGGAA